MPRGSGSGGPAGSGPGSPQGWALRALWLFLVAVGLGALLVPLVVVGLTMMFWLQRLPVLWERWNMWLGALVFTLAFLGLLAFFLPEGFQMGGPVGDGPNFGDVSLGGRLGQVMIGITDLSSPGRTALGVLRVAGLLIVG